MMNNLPVVAVVIPYYQKIPGLLTQAVNSVFEQDYDGEVTVIVVDDGSPCSAKDDLKTIQSRANRHYIILEQSNGGAGSARNRALNNVPDGTKYVAFLDSDDRWLPSHLDTGVQALEQGYDAYFSDHYPALFPDESNFERIGTLNLSEHKLLDPSSQIYEMTISAIEHTVADGGGVIGTSNVIYNYGRFKELRFREEFYNGQDFFFWMDLSNLGANWVFSTKIECHCGRGLNIYSGSGWGTDKLLQRLRNELFIWTSVEKFYELSPELKKANRSTINSLKDSVIRDLIHRIVKKKAIPKSIMLDIMRMVPGTLLFIFIVPFKIIRDKLTSG